MKMYISSIVLCCLSGIVCAGDLNPPAAPSAGGTMKTLDEVQPRIAVNDDNTPGDATSVYRITEPGSYYLTGNIEASGKHGISIGADNVTLDLMGFCIRSSYEIADPPANLDFDGIYIDSKGKDVEIRNGIIESARDGSYAGFRNGIYSPYQPFSGVYTRYLRISDVRVFRSRSCGINPSGYFSTIQDCHAAENGDVGIVVLFGTVTNCVAYQNNGTGISASGCVVTQCKSLNNYGGGNGIYLGSRGVATENSVSGNSGAGIEAISGCVISRNTINGSTGNGITAGDKTQVRDNAVDDSGAIGIEAGVNCVIIGNTVSGSDLAGILTGGGTTIDKNSSYDNTQHGIETGYGCVVTNNTAYQNAYSGIVTGLSAVAKNNNAYDNEYHGIHISGFGSTVIGNAARNNGYSGIMVNGYSLVDQNAAYSNNQSGGSYVNLNAPTSCEVGLNMAP